MAEIGGETGHGVFLVIGPTVARHRRACPGYPDHLIQRPPKQVRRRRLVIASAAKQSSAQCKPPLDCFVARASGNDTRLVLAMRRIRVIPSKATESFASEQEGRRSADRRHPTKVRTLSGAAARGSPRARLSALHRGSRHAPKRCNSSPGPRFLELPGSNGRTLVASLKSRAPRRPVVMPADRFPKPPGSGLRNRARAPHSLHFQDRI